jgi:hypothetical protein
VTKIYIHHAESRVGHFTYESNKGEGIGNKGEGSDDNRLTSKTGQLMMTNLRVGHFT